MELLLAGHPRTRGEVAIDARQGEDDPRGPIDLGGGWVAAGVHVGGHLVVPPHQPTHGHHRPAAPSAVEADVPLALLEAFRHLDEIEGAPIIFGLNLIGDLLQLSGRSVELPRDLNPQLRMSEDGVVVHSDATVCCHDFPVSSHHQGVDLRRTRLVRTRHLVEALHHSAETPEQLAVHANRAYQIPTLVILKALDDVHCQARHLVRMLSSYLLYARSAHAAEDHHWGLGSIIDYHAGVELLRNVQSLFHQHL